MCQAIEFSDISPPSGLYLSDKVGIHMCVRVQGRLRDDAATDTDTALILTLMLALAVESSFRKLPASLDSPH